MDGNMKLFRFIITAVIPMVAAFVLAGCARVEEPDYREKDYGYVQFKLYKEASYPGTKAAQLEYLRDVAKLKVTLRYEDNLISQTLVVGASSDEAAEYGLRSDKLKLLSGEYQVVTFTLYNKVDEPVYDGTPSEGNNAFSIIAGDSLFTTFLPMLQREER